MSNATTTTTTNSTATSKAGVTSTYEDDDEDDAQLLAMMEKASELSGRPKKSEPDPRLLAAKKKSQAKKAARPKDEEDNEDDGNDEEDEDNEDEDEDDNAGASSTSTAGKKAKKTAATELADRERDYAAMSAFHTDYLAQMQSAIKCKYSTARTPFRQVEAADFADDMQDTCCRCDTPIRGRCSAAYYLPTTNEWMHATCCACAGTAVVDGNPSICGKTAGLSSKSGTWFHADRDGNPVCVKHVDTHALAFPVFDPETEAEDAITFKKTNGFVIIQTKITNAANESMCRMLTRTVGALAGWSLADTNTKINEELWYMHVNYPGIAHGEIGIVDVAKPSDAAPVEARDLLSKSFRADLLLSKEAWKFRQGVLPAAKPFFDSATNVQSGICPMLVVPAGSATAGAVRCFTSDPRMKTLKGKGAATRKKDKQFLNGVYAASDGSKGLVHVLACADSWKINGKPFTFEEEWFKCVPRAPNSAVFPNDFPLKQCMMPIRLQAGQLVLFSDSRPYSIHSDDTNNFFGSLVSWSSIGSKKVTAEQRALMALWSVVPWAQVSQAGYRYNKGLKCLIKDPSLPAHLSDICTPVTDADIPSFADVLFGTKRTTMADIPPQYHGQGKPLSDPDVHNIIELSEEDETPVSVHEPHAQRKPSAIAIVSEEAKRRNNAINKKRIMESEGEISSVTPVPAHVADKVVAASMKVKPAPGAASSITKPAPKKSKVAPPPPPVEIEEQEEMEVVEVEEEPVASVEAVEGEEGQEEEETKKTKKKPKKTKVGSKASKKRERENAERYGNPVMDPDEEVDETQVPSELRMNPEFVAKNRDADVLAEAYGTLVMAKKISFEVSQANPDAVVATVDGADQFPFTILDAFSAFKIEEDLGDDLRGAVFEWANDTRATRIINGKEGSEGRVVRVYGPGKLKVSTKYTEVSGDMPECIESLLGLINANCGLELDSAIVFGTNRYKDSIGKVCDPGFDLDSKFVVISLGASNRFLRFKAATETVTEDGQTVKKDSLLADLRIPSGIALAMNGTALGKDDGLRFEVPPLPSGARTSESEFTTAHVLLILGKKSLDEKKGAARKKPAAKKADATKLAAKAAKMIPKAPVAAKPKPKVKAKSDTELLADVFSFANSSEYVDVLTNRFASECRQLGSLYTTANISKRPDDIAELRSFFSALYKQVTGTEWDDGISNAPIAPEEVASMFAPPKPAAPARSSKPAPPKKAAVAAAAMEDEEDEEKVTDFMQNLPDKTTKLIVTNGKVARRGTRERVPVTNSKQDIAEREAEPILRKQHTDSENRRRAECRRKGIKFSPISFETWSSIRKVGDLGSEDSDDGELVASDDDDDEEDGDAIVSSGEEEDDDEEEGDVVMGGMSDEDEDDPVTQFNVKSDKFSVLFDMYEGLFDGPKKVHNLADAFKNTNLALDKAQSDFDVDAMNRFSERYDVLEALLETYLEANPSKRKKPIVKALPDIDVEGLGIANLGALAEAGVIEGWNVGADPDVSQKFVYALLEAAVMLARKVAFGGTIPKPALQTLIAYNANPDFSEEAMQKVIDLVIAMEEQEEEVVAQPEPAKKVKTPAKKTTEPEKVKTPVKKAAEPEKITTPKKKAPAVSPKKPKVSEPPKKKQHTVVVVDEDAESDDPMALPDVEVLEPVVAGQEQEESDTGGSGEEEVVTVVPVPEVVEDAPEAMDEAEDAPEQEEAVDQEQEEEEVVPVSMDQGADEEEDQNHGDDGAVGSAEEATRDHRRAAPVSNVRPAVTTPTVEPDVVMPTPTPAPIPAPTPEPATSKPKIVYHFEGDKFVATVKTKGGVRLMASGTTTEEVWGYAKERYDSTPGMHKRKIEEWFQVRPLPLNWKAILQKNSLEPILGQLLKLPAHHLFPDLADAGAK